MSKLVQCSAILSETLEVCKDLKAPRGLREELI